MTRLSCAERLGRLAALALLLAGAAPVAAQLSVPPLTGRVVDTADMLSPTIEAVLTERLAAFEDSTGTQVAVLTIPSLGGDVLEEYATRVFREWALGQAGRDNGVLLLISRDDRELRIEVGYGLEGTLTDARASEIVRTDIVPRFRDGDFQAGILAGTEAILDHLEGKPAQRRAAPEKEGPDFVLLLGGVLFGLLMGGAPYLYLRDLLIGTGMPGVRGTLQVGLVALGMGVGTAVGLASVAAMVGLASGKGVGWLMNLLVVGLPLGAMGVDVWRERSPVYGAARRRNRAYVAAISDAQSRGERSVLIDGVEVRVPPPDYSSVSSGNSWSGSSSSSFSGGGGSSGGGGASGGW